MDEVVETENSYYDVSETSIKDLSMLGTHGEKLCHNLDVHWMIPTCDSAKPSRSCVYNNFLPTRVLQNTHVRKCFYKTLINRQINLPRIRLVVETLSSPDGMKCIMNQALLL